MVLGGFEVCLTGLCMRILGMRDVRFVKMEIAVVGLVFGAANLVIALEI